MQPVMRVTVTLLCLCGALWACRTARPTATSVITPAVTAPAPSATATILRPARYGVVVIEPVGSSDIRGTFTAQDNGDGTTQLAVLLNQAADFNPWGLFTTGDCTRGVPENTRPVFALPDIEAGYKEETVETATYQTVPGNLSVVIYGITADGSQQMVACADLGPPMGGAGASATQAMGPVTPTCPAVGAATPQPLPPGAWLAFSATRNSNTDIYVLNVDMALQGASQAPATRLTTDPAADFDPTWSPDGTRIAFRSQRDGNDEIYLMNADGTCQTNLTHDPVNDWSPAWSPDGTRIAFARFFDANAFPDVALVNVDGSGLRRLTEAHGEYPAWSPDGTRIAFASARDGNYEIYVMQADGTGQTRLTNNPAYDMAPTWSADGTRIAFDTQRDSYPPAEVGIGPEFEIHVMKADGSGDTRLTNNQEEDRFPAWGPNGRIAFTRNGTLFVMQSDGSAQEQVFESGTFPAWRPSLPAISP